MPQHFPLMVRGARTDSQRAEVFSPYDGSLIATACQAENSVTLAEFNAKNGAALDVLLTKHGVKLHRFSNEILQEIGKISGEVVAEEGSSDKITRKIYESFLKSRKASISWSKLGDQSYWNARLLPFKYG